MEIEEKICRLCLENCDNNFKVIEENATEILSILLECNLAISEEAVMCLSCTQSFKACSNFKSRCYDVEDFIVQSTNCKGSKAKLTINDIYSTKEACDVPESHNICRLCMDSLGISCFVSLDSEEGGMMLKKMIETYFPKLNLGVTKTPVICVPCQESLQHYFRFVMNCLIVEEKIKKYYEAAKGGGINLINLKDVLEFTTKNIFDKDDRIKIQDKFCGVEDYEDEQKCSIAVPCALDNISTNKNIGRSKLEETFLEEIDFKIEIKPENLEETEEQQFNDEIDFKIEIKPENLEETEEQQFNDEPKFAIKSEEVDQFDEIKLKHSYCQKMVNEHELKQESLNSCQNLITPPWSWLPSPAPTYWSCLVPGPLPPLPFRGEMSPMACLNHARYTSFPQNSRTTSCSVSISRKFLKMFV